MNQQLNHPQSLQNPFLERYLSEVSFKKDLCGIGLYYADEYLENLEKNIQQDLYELINQWDLLPDFVQLQYRQLEKQWKQQAQEIFQQNQSSLLSIRTFKQKQLLPKHLRSQIKKSVQKPCQTNKYFIKKQECATSSSNSDSSDIEFRDIKKKNKDQNQ